MKTLSFAILTGLSSLFYLVEIPNQERLEKVQNGELILTCHIGENQKVIDPKKVIDYNSEISEWIFINGSAKNCTLMPVQNTKLAKK
ncbi:hypothetical protein CSB11_00690 [Candidatus Campbellbacteria bacterium]|nr:MAG: hypothetical protein CSB11_00690 [Candidatus Campbellbacteria bacterium]